MVGSDDHGLFLLVITGEHRVPLARFLIEVGGMRLLTVGKAVGDDDCRRTHQVVYTIREADINTQTARNALNNVGSQHPIADAQLYVATDDCRVKCHATLLPLGSESRVIEFEHLGILIDKAVHPSDAVHKRHVGGKVVAPPTEFHHHIVLTAVLRDAHVRHLTH